MACVYGLVSTKNISVIRYIGASKYDEPSARLNKHYEHAMYTDLNRPVYDWMRKHLADGYSINAVTLAVVSLEDVAAVEQSYVAEHRKLGRTLLNLTDGGEGVSGYLHSDSSRQKMREAWARRKERSSSTDRSLSAEHKAKISASMAGRKQSADHTRKIAESRKSKREQQN